MDLESRVTKSGKYFKMTKEYQISSLEGLSQVSECLIQMSREANVIAFYGAMGAGKTTLIKNLCHKLGVSDEVNSPTFAIVNEYLDQEQNSIYHFDFYRIKKIEEAYDIGYENYFYSDSLCLIEWPEMIEPLLPDKYIRVDIKLGDSDEKRVITCCVVE